MATCVFDQDSIHIRSGPVFRSIAKKKRSELLEAELLDIEGGAEGDLGACNSCHMNDVNHPRPRKQYP